MARFSSGSTYRVGVLLVPIIQMCKYIFRYLTICLLAIVLLCEYIWNLGTLSVPTLFTGKSRRTVRHFNPWKRLMGCILRLQNFPTVLYIVVTVLTRRIHICKKRFMCYFWWVILCLLKLHLLINYYVIFSGWICT